MLQTALVFFGEILTQICQQPRQCRQDFYMKVFYMMLRRTRMLKRFIETYGFREVLENRKAVDVRLVSFYKS